MTRRSLEFWRPVGSVCSDQERMNSSMWDQCSERSGALHKQHCTSRHALEVQWPQPRRTLRLLGLLPLLGQEQASYLDTGWHVWLSLKAGCCWYGGPLSHPHRCDPSIVTASLTRVVMPTPDGSRHQPWNLNCERGSASSPVHR
jgi:hypothetical protein